MPPWRLPCTLGVFPRLLGVSPGLSVTTRRLPVFPRASLASPRIAPRAPLAGILQNSVPLQLYDGVRNIIAFLATTDYVKT